MMRRASLDSLAAFAVVARALSFTRAAAELRVSPSALSHTIRELEVRLGIRLLQRNSRSVSVTEAGERLLRTLDPALADIGGALEALDREREVVSGKVRLTATRNAFETVIRPLLPGFFASHPAVNVEVLIDYQLRDIIAERFDAGIRIGEKLEQDMIAVAIGPELRMAVVASPSYLAARGTPQTPQDLARHDCVNYRMMASGETLPWEFEREDRTLAIKVTGSLTFNEPELMLEAALDALGIAYVLEREAEPHVAAGRLVRLLIEWTAPFPGYFLYYPSRRQMSPVLAALIAALRRQSSGAAVAMKPPAKPSGCAHPERRGS